MKTGAILSYLSILISIVIALLYTPIMIRLLGQAEYGLYSLIGSVAAYFSILDMGLGNAIVRYTARNRVIGDKEIESNQNGMFFMLYSLIGFITILAGVIFYNNIDTIFSSGLTPIELGKAKVMVIILIINFALSFPLSIFGSIMQAHEKFIVIKIVSITRTILVPATTLPILFLGYGSISMVLITTIVNISLLLFNVYYSFKHLHIKMKFRKVNFHFLKEIIGYSFFVFLGVIVDQIYWNTDQFILGIFTGTVPVAIYAIAMQFINLYKQFSTAISGLFLPRASMMIANNATNEELTQSMVKYGRVQYLIMSIILSGFILFGRPFINIWAGAAYESAYFITLIVMIPLTIPLIQNFGISVLYAKNLQGFRSIILIIIATLNILLSIPLAQKYGGIGTATATSLSLVIGNIIIMNIYYHYKIGMNMFVFWKNILIMSMPVLLSLIFGCVVNYLISENSLFALFLKILIYSSVFLGLMWILGLNKYEKGLILSITNRFKKVL